MVNKRLTSTLALMAIALLVQQVTMAQPPPPHPGGSGNQGAAIEGLIYLLGLAAYLGFRKLKA